MQEALEAEGEPSGTATWKMEVLLNFHRQKFQIQSGERQKGVSKNR